MKTIKRLALIGAMIFSLCFTMPFAYADPDEEPEQTESQETEQQKPVLPEIPEETEPFEPEATQVPEEKPAEPETTETPVEPEKPNEPEPPAEPEKPNEPPKPAERPKPAEPEKSHEHVFGEWTVTREASCTEEGQESRTCSQCGEKETRPVEKIPHDYEWVIETMATENAEGSGYRHCKVCGKNEPAEVIPAHKILDDSQTSWEDSQKNGLKIKTTAAAADLQAIQVDGRQIGTDSFAVKDGAILIQEPFLSSLEAGTHVLVLQYTTGSCTTGFAVQKTEDSHETMPPMNSDWDEGIPGPSAGLAMAARITVIFLAVAAVTGAVTLIVMRIRKK